MRPEDYFNEELARYKRAFGDGYYAALLDAFRLCVENELPLPDWGWRPIAEHVETDYASRRARGGKRGRTGGRLAADEMDRIHYLRWSWASHWLENRNGLLAYGYATTRAGAFEFTCKMLRGTRARGAPGAIKDSYERVERAKKAGKMLRYEAAGDDIRR
jgi:hypothetical protein